MFKITLNNVNYSTGKRLVQIQSTTGNLIIVTAEFDDSLERWDSLTEEQLINHVHEWYYRNNLQGRFINEAVDLTQQKAKEIETIVAKANELFQQAHSELEEIKQANDLSQGTLVELGEMVFDHETRLGLLEGMNSV